MPPPTYTLDPALFGVRQSPPYSAAKVVVRWVGVLVAIIPCSVAAYYLTRVVTNANFLLANSDKVDWAAVPYSDGMKAAASQRLDWVRANTQTGLIGLAAMWGMFLARKREERWLKLDTFDDWPEVIVFWFATLTLVGCAATAAEYADVMAIIHSRVATTNPAANPPALRIPDFMDERIDNLAVWQSYLLAVGALQAGWVLFSAHILKEDHS